MNLVVLLFLFVPCFAQLHAINIYYKPVDSGKPGKLGLIKYDSLDNRADFVQDANSVDFKGLASIGFENDSGIHYSAFGQLDSELPKDFIVHLIDDRVFKVDYALGEPGTSPASSNVYIALPAKGPQPPIKEPIKLVGNKVPEPEPEKTFLQKYWYYIVPIVLMTLVSGGAEN
jgi:hypothetical protein